MANAELRTPDSGLRIPKRVIVVGCGIVGACCAYYLRKAGWKVTMVDRGLFGNACSHGNCGYISPSHALPLAMPGVVRKTLPTMFRRTAPVHVKPRFDPALWAWLVRFAMRCRREPMLESAQARQTLLNSSLQLYQQIIQEEEIDCEWEKRGCLFVFKTDVGMEAYATTDRILGELGLPAKRYDGRSLCELEPALQPGLAGAWYYEIDSHLRPDKLMAGLRVVLELQGVEIHEQTEVQGLVSDSRRAAALRTAKGDIPADHFVVATGSWTPLLNRWLGTKIPIQPGKGYSTTMPRPAICPRIPMLLQEVKVGVTPMQSGYRLGSTMEFAGYDTTLNRSRLEALRQGAAQYLREPYCDPVQEEWYGWRPMTYDGKPIIDRSPTLENVHIAAGHNMLGLSMGAATGRLVSELAGAGPPHIDPRPYAVDRF